MDISSLTSGLGIQLERSAAQQLGTAVENFARQPTGAVTAANRLPAGTVTQGIQNVTGTASSASGVQNASVWDSVQYAADMVTYAPKHRFLFKVHFHFNPPYVGDQDQRIFSYMIKEITRPKYNFEYQDINMYNFRTKVPTNVKREPMSITFYDDIGNNVQEFFNYYVRSHCPIDRTNIETSSSLWESSGMNFAPPNPASGTGGEYSASFGQLNDGAINMLHYIELEQYYAHGTKKNIFKFINPRVESFDFDDSSVDGQDLHWMKMTFNYDGLIVETMDAKGPTKGAFGNHDIMGETKPWVNASGNPMYNPDRPNSTLINSSLVATSDWKTVTQTAGTPNFITNAAQNAASSFLSPGAISGMITNAAYNGKAGVVSGITSGLEAQVKRTLFGQASKIGQASVGLAGSAISEGASKLVNAAQSTSTMTDAQRQDLINGTTIT